MIPSPVDRRLAIRRIRILRIAHPERRVLPDRRLDMRSSRLYFPSTEKGWLCFESETARRRLRPAPHDWAVRADEELESLCALAEVQRGDRSENG